MHASMRRKANCWDHVPMESFCDTLMNEPVHHHSFGARPQAIPAITKWVEVFYNRQQRQARLGYLSPVGFAQRFYRNQRAA